MKKFIIFICVIAIAYTEDVNPVLPPEPTNSVITSTTKPTEIPTKPTITTSTTVSTTAAPTTASTTAAPTTASTTTAATTTAPTTASTTTKPTSAPTSATTTAKPTPKKPEVLKLNVTDNQNITCIIVNMAVMFKIPYETNNGTHHAEVIIPKSALATGACGETVQNISIQWNPDMSEAINMITMEFMKNDTKKEFMISKIFGKLIVDSTNFPNAKDNKSINFTHVNKEFITPLHMSYKCDKEEPLNMTLSSNVNVTVATLIVSKLRMEAFRNSTNHDFSSAEDCEPFQPSGIVPIAVGCSLAILIIIVLIAYLIGRRRSQARGYLSMFSERQREEEYIPMKNLSCFGQ